MSNISAVRVCLVALVASAGGFSAIAQASLPVAAQKSSAAAPSSKAAPLTRSALWSKLEGQFRSLDTNKDGFVSQAEIAADLVVQQKKIAANIRQRREAAFTAMDKNKDGQLSRDEFLAAGPQVNGPAPDGSKVMGRMDTDKDGKLTLTEFSSAPLSNFDRLDTNRDGTISPDEAGKAAPKR